MNDLPNPKHKKDLLNTLEYVSLTFDVYFLFFIFSFTYLIWIFFQILP